MCKKTNYHKTSNTQIDKFMRPLIEWLKNRAYLTVARCCGHGKYPMTIILKHKWDDGHIQFVEILSDTTLPRKRNFYKKDSEDYYYIPEVSGNSSQS